MQIIKNNIKQYFLISICIVITLVGCSGHFGSQAMIQSLIKVETLPPRIPYYILELGVSDTYFSGKDDTILKGSRTYTNFDSYLSTISSVRDISNGSYFAYASGAYTLVLDCEYGFKRNLIYIPRNDRIVIEASCQ